ELTDQTRYAEQPCEHQHAARNESHVLTGNRQEVVEARGAEPIIGFVRKSTVLAKDDAFHYRRAISGQPSRDGALQLSSQGVRNAAKPPAPAHDPPAVDEEDHVHALTPQPRPLVKPVLGSARGRHADERIQDGALRRPPP